MRTTTELPAILKRCESPNALVLWVVRRRTAWQLLGGVLQVVPTENATRAVLALFDALLSSDMTRRTPTAVPGPAKEQPWQ